MSHGSKSYLFKEDTNCSWYDISDKKAIAKWDKLSARSHQKCKKQLLATKNCTKLGTNNDDKQQLAVQ